jgi:tRNA nucleotidyltransferase (CCA-adding enzyme)
MTYKTYLVGGAVRDLMLKKLGYDVHSSDRDWVVVGGTAEELAAQGFIPVGADFPVFLHPKTHEEYALARTERKTARGYHGFQFHASPDVTLPEDLQRRDLTINAMAIDEDGTLVDPYGGLDDLRNRILRHVSLAFKEDPVRILRLARFSARFPDFSVAESTKDLLEEMVIGGEADALVPERVWAELSRGLMERKPSRMLQVLLDCGYWERARRDVPVTESTLALLDSAAASGAPLCVRAAMLFSGADRQTIRQTAEAMRLPSDIASFVQLFLQAGPELLSSDTAEKLCSAFARADVLRRPDRFVDLLCALKLVSEQFDKPLTEELASAYCSVDAGQIASQAADKSAIASDIARARVQAVLAAARRLR